MSGSAKCQAGTGEFGAARDAMSLWLWLVPVDAGAPAAMGQAVIDVPEGRYLVESYDIEARAWVSRESALASPLVIGVPHRTGAVCTAGDPDGRLRIRHDRIPG